jgi:hypothetical protein
MSAPAPEPAQEMNRQVLHVTYHAPEAFFPIPAGLDLKNDPNVRGYGVKWNTLHIDFKDGTSLEIEAIFEPEIDLKYPADDEIEDMDDCGAIDEEDYPHSVAELFAIQNKK